MRILFLLALSVSMYLCRETLPQTELPASSQSEENLKTEEEKLVRFYSELSEKLSSSHWKSQLELVLKQLAEGRKGEGEFSLKEMALINLVLGDFYSGMLPVPEKGSPPPIELSKAFSYYSRVDSFVPGLERSLFMLGFINFLLDWNLFWFVFCSDILSATYRSSFRLHHPKSTSRTLR
eukprot:TRINITY_DN3001_c0_g1_i9.p1 TRINITY_DN3001_c0_g1~~TRINITY_DN3001_c0_g1_i9.p1  ORF type:complete len:179 (-),score=32.20 TRINITY_DN3001_c0_g1_i9:2-538(-)